jgi:hypothetical protein
MVFSNSCNFAIEVFVKLYSPFVKKIPLNPLFFQRGNLRNEEYFPSLKKRGKRRFWTSVISSLDGLMSATADESLSVLPLH